MDYNAILTEINEDVLIIRINRPKAMNALNKQVMSELTNVFDRLDKGDIQVRGIIITGAGDRAFIAGADITEFVDLTREEGTAISLYGHKIFNRIEQSTIPVIAAIQGYSLGGGNELAMACHIRIAGEKAKFGQPESNLGLLPGYGATQRLCHLVGRAKAMEWMMTGEIINAAEALSSGMINKVVPQGTELQEAMSFLDTIFKKGPKAIASVIRCVNACFDPSLDGFALESELFGQMLADEESAEGVAAFLEKRTPEFGQK